MIFKRRLKDPSKKIDKAMSRIYPDMNYGVVIFDGRQEYSDIRYISNAPKKRVHQILRQLFKEWKQKHQI